VETVLNIRSKEGTAPGGVSKTGDGANLPLWIAMVLAGAVVLGTWRTRSKKNR